VLEIAAERLFALDRLEQRLEIPFAEAAAAVALDHFEEQRGPILDRLGEDLQQISLLVAIDRPIVSSPAPGAERRPWGRTGNRSGDDTAVKHADQYARRCAQECWVKQKKPPP